jgi:hypothetical protein
LPNWKKLILSGSDAALNSLNVTTSVTAASFTGSFSGSVAAPGSTTQVVFNNGGTLSANSGFVYSGSNVGIGVTNPPVTLSVQGQAYFADDIYLRDGSTTTGDFLVRIYDSSDDGIIDVYRNNAVVNRIHGNGNSYITAGNFGIGTASPASTTRLQVQGSGATDATSALNVTNSTPTSLLFVRDDGNVGIGTDSPANRLTVANGNIGSGINNLAFFGLQQTGNPSIGDGVRINLGTSAGITRAAAIEAVVSSDLNGHHLAFLTNVSANIPTERMRITSAGNVGINNTSPGSRLVIQGSGATDATSALNVTNSTPTSLLFVRDDGNIGIGITTPSQKLDVQGNIAITKVLLSNQENLDVDSGATRVIATISSTSYDAAFFDFVIKKSTNLRAGTLYAVHNGITTEFTETSTQDLGNTSDVTLSADISGGNIRLLATTLTNDWIIKTLVRGI